MNRQALPLAVLAALVLAYALPGVFGHDPWKPDEPYTFGAILHLLRSGDWIVPAVGGVPFVEKPPLFYWAAALTADLGASLLPLPDAARLASLLFMAITITALAGASRLAWGEGAAAAATLLLIGSIGLVPHAHRMQVDLALMAGFAVAALGLAGAIHARPWSGVVLGVGVAAGFLAKGLLAPAAIAATCLALPLLFESWRTRGYAMQLAIAALVALPAVTVWPALLWMRSAELFDAWFWANNIGRFTGISTEKLGAQGAPGFWLETLPWFLFPAWIFAAAGLWRERRNFWDSPAMQLGVAMALSIAAILLASRSARSLYALPLLVPVALLGVAAARPAPQALDRVLAAFAIATGALAILAAWLIWLFLLVHERVPWWIPIEAWLPARFDMPVAGAEIIAAAALTLGFTLLVTFRSRIAADGLALWVGAVAVTWGLAHTLWLPWLEHARGYRALFAEISRRLPPGTKCIVMNGVGESERALVEYFVGVAPRPRFDREDDCGALLWEGDVNHDRIWPGPGRWKLVWRGHRPGEKVEGFDLFLRPEAPLPGESWDDPRRTGGR